MTATINKKNKEQVIRELLQEFPEDSVKMRENKYPYIEAGLLKKRLDEVVGVLNYRLGKPEIDIKSIEGESVVICTTEFVLLDDEGNEVTSFYGLGTSTFNRFGADHEKAGRIIAADNDVKKAFTDSKKSIYEQLGIGVAQVEQRKKKASATGKASAGAAEEIQFLRLRQKGGKCIKLDAVTTGGEKLTVCIWENSPIYGELSGKSIDEFISHGMTQPIRLSGIRGSYNGEAQFSVQHIAA